MNRTNKGQQIKIWYKYCCLLKYKIKPEYTEIIYLPPYGMVPSMGKGGVGNKNILI